MAAAPHLRRSDSAQGEFSPLKRFVVAKKKISDVFEQLLNYVKETSEFVEGERISFPVLIMIVMIITLREQLLEVNIILCCLVC